MHDGKEQQAQRIYQEMALLALDLFACIIAMRIDAGPPYMGCESSAKIMPTVLSSFLLSRKNRR
jgi:hypothetical protein